MRFQTKVFLITTVQSHTRWKITTRWEITNKMKMGKALQKKIKKSNTQGKHFICRCGKKNWNTCLLWVLATHDD